MARDIGRFFQIPMWMFKPYVVFGPEANRKVLVTDRDKAAWRNTDPVTDLLGRGVLVVDDEEHDHYRRIMEPSLHSSKMVGYQTMMLAQTDRVSSQWQDGTVIDMLVESRRIALLIIMQALFGRDAWHDLPRIWKPILKSIRFISPGIWILGRKLPRWGYSRPLRELDRYLFEIIVERREQEKDLPDDLLQHLIDAGLTDQVIRDQMLTMLIAGHDTSTALLAWTFALLGQHPHVHERLIKTLNAPDESLFLDQVIKESMRLYPPIHIGNRHVKQEMKFAGGTIPAGERLFHSIYLTHRDPQVWENPEDFAPQRFAHGRNTPSFSYIPFGGGPRVCIGAAFGQAEARIVLGRLLKTHTFAFTGHKIRAYMGATLEPHPGVMMKVTKRQ
jgi:cytochrome P450